MVPFSKSTLSFLKVFLFPGKSQDVAASSLLLGWPIRLLAHPPLFLGEPHAADHEGIVRQTAVPSPLLTPLLLTRHARRRWLQPLGLRSSGNEQRPGQWPSPSMQVVRRDQRAGDRLSNILLQACNPLCLAFGYGGPARWNPLEATICPAFCSPEQGPQTWRGYDILLP